MKINFMVRFKNPVFWVNLAAAIFLPILTYMGINIGEITTWGILFDIISEAYKNPAIIASAIISVWNLITDPTTPGISDSKRALSYILPGGEEKK